MISYDLECEAGHIFEGWFDSMESFNEQTDRGLVACPACGSTKVSRRLSTFSIPKKRPQSQPPMATEQQTRQLWLNQVVSYIKQNFEDVGSDFATEALKMHYGVTDYRNIRGVSTVQEEETLKEEGIDFFKVPIPTNDTPEEES